MMHEVMQHEFTQPAMASTTPSEANEYERETDNYSLLIDEVPQTRAVTTLMQDKKISFDEVREKVQSDDRGKWDIVLPRSELAMRDGRLTFPDCNAYECEHGLAPSPWATGQICQRLNIPTSYFKRCPSELQDIQFNHWNRKAKTGQTEMPETDNPFADESNESYPSLDGNNNNGYGEPEEYVRGWSNSSSNGHQFKNGIYAGSEKNEYWLLRSKDQTLRALLTDRYTPLDNRVLLDALYQTLPLRLQIQWLALDEDSFHLRIIDPSLSREVLPDDPLMAGIHICNSETGRRSVTIDSILYRQVCTNGLIKMVRGKSILSQRHVAVSPPHFYALLRQALPIALTTANAFVDQMAWSTTETVCDVEAEMKSLMQHWHLSQGFVEQVKASLQRERADQQETVFGLVNAVTQAAQSLDAENRYEMEVLAGKLLERKSMQGAKAGPRSHLVPVPALNGGSNINEAIEAAEVLFEAEVVSSESSDEETAS